jgi:hypothetical protein
MKKKKSRKNTFFCRFLAKNTRKIAKNRLFFTKNAFFSHFFAKKNTRGYDPFFCKICRDPAHHFLTTGIPSRPIFASKAFGAKKQNKNKNFFLFLFMLKIFFYSYKKYFYKKIKKIIKEWKAGDSSSMKHLGQFPRGLYKATFGARRKVRDLSFFIINYIFLIFLYSSVVPRSVDGRTPPVCFVLKHAKKYIIVIDTIAKDKKIFFCKSILYKKIFF